MVEKLFNCPHCGKIISKDTLTSAKRREKVKCTSCGSQSNWKDGKRKTDFGEIQRYICRDCGYRFSAQ